MLLGSMLSIVAASHDAWSTISVSAAQPYHDAIGQAAGESVEEDREEETESEVHIVAGTMSHGGPLVPYCGNAASGFNPPTRGNGRPAASIRGPPSA